MRDILHIGSMTAGGPRRDETMTGVVGDLPGRALQDDGAVVGSGQ